MAIVLAEVEFEGIKPLLYNSFTVEALSLKRPEMKGSAGNNPEEWKSSVKVTESGQFYLPFSYAFACALNGAKMLRKGKGTYQKDVAATLEILDEKILLNRNLPKDILSKSELDDVFLDVRGVTNKNSRGSKNIRYRVCLNPGWSGKFRIQFDNTIVGKEHMEQIFIDAGKFSGFGDGRSIGFGKFSIKKFSYIGEKIA
ncbi:hypothetical protein [Pontibacillus sp. HMF3514]|uniref:hypothetical protein n=1 Tax=Pontibacillus sp. HMF3514 TaxID=2692425 RepID=UPI00131FDCD0|nr:hypothetical protein [Pontibacillus sp. HMF3514]QHE52788.1 hypothetical protein GS400_12465 [Pontibacillus sp. HMF3514]